ncbi:MAG: alkaline phosphatase family protein [Thermoplasmatota archaeon]
MGFLDRLLRRTKKTTIIALDGVNYSFIKEMYKKGEFHNLGGSNFMEISSVHSSDSTVIWSTFLTGKNPGKHNIFGSEDINKKNSEMYTTLFSNLKSKTIWEYFNEQKKRIFLMNIPLTYPPSKINGMMISGFPCTDLAKGTYPRDLTTPLKNMSYRIDVESSLALENLEKFLKNLDRTFEARKKVMYHYMKEDWDLFMIRFTEQERLNHFMLENWLEDGPFKEEYLEIYKKLDKMVGKVRENIGADENLIVMSTYGFSPIKSEVQLNYWFKEKGYLEDIKRISNLTPQTKAFSLPFGRVYINESSAGYKKFRQKLVYELQNLRNPISGEEIIDNVFLKEEIYNGPYLERAPDIILNPKYGYDLKGDFHCREFMTKGLRTGMHVTRDSFVYCNQDMKDEDPKLVDFFPTLMELARIKKPNDLEGDSILNS